MFCTNCGARIDDRTQRCPQCGAAFGLTAASSFVQPSKIIQQTNVLQQPYAMQQPQAHKKRKTGLIILICVISLAAVGALLAVLLLGRKNVYQKLYQAVQDSVRMDSAVISAVEDYQYNTEEISFCIDTNSSALQYYFEYDSNVYGLYDGNMFRYRNRRGSGVKFPASTVLTNSNETNLELFLIAALCSGKLTDKDFLHTFFDQAMNDTSGSLEKSREATDLANIRSAYAQIVTYYLENPSKTPEAITVKAMQTVEGWQSNPEPCITYQGNGQQEQYYFSASVRGYVVGIEFLSNGVARPRVTEAVDLEKNASSLQSENEFDAALDILFDKLSDEEWMNQSCSIEITEGSDSDDYDVQIRPRSFYDQCLREIKDCLDSETYQEARKELQYMDNDTIRLRFTIQDGKITRIVHIQSNTSINLSYNKDVLSSIRVQADDDYAEVSFYNVNSQKFDKNYIEEILDYCEED